MKWQSLPPVFERYTVDANGCWIWPHVRNDGYGRIKKDGKTWTAHRFFYVHLVGPIPDGLTPTGRRVCRACNRRRAREYQARRAS